MESLRAPVALGLLSALLLFVFGLAVIDIDRESLWLDESWTAWTVHHDGQPPETLRDAARYARDSVTTTLERVKSDVHPPLYFLLLDGWVLLLGEHEFVLRLPSAFAGLLALAAVYALGKQWFGTRTGLSAVLLTGTAGFFLYYAQEARPYTLYLASLLLATYSYGRWWKHHRRHDGIIYSVLMALALYTHYVSVLVFMAHLLHHLLTRFRWKMFLPYLIAGILTVCWLPFALLQWQANPGGVAAAWLPSDWGTLAALWLVLTGGYGVLYLLPFVLGRALPDAITKPNIRAGVLLLLLGAVLPLVALLGLNAQGTSSFQLRYVIFVLPAGALLVGYALGRMRLPTTRTAPYVALFLLLWIAHTQLALRESFWEDKPPWREAIMQAADERLAEEPALVHVPPHSPLAYYDRRTGLVEGISISLGWRPFSPQEVRTTAAALDNAPRAWALLPAQDPSSWDAIIALAEGRGVGYRDSVQGTLLYRFDAQSDEALSFQFGTLAVFEGRIGQRWQSAPGEQFCYTLHLRTLQAIPERYSVGLYLTRGYKEVIAQHDEALGAWAAESTLERDQCLWLPDDTPLETLHLRLAIYDWDTLQRLPVRENGLLWGDYLLVGTLTVLE